MLTLIPDNIVHYIALSSDIVGNQISGASIVGAKIFLTDTGTWKIILPDLTLADYEWIQDVTSTFPNIPTTSAMSGQLTVTSAGTAVQGTSVSLLNGVYIKALSTNTGLIYVGYDGTASNVTSTTGFELAAGDIILLQVANLNNLWFNSSANNQKVCWIKG